MRVQFLAEVRLWDGLIGGVLGASLGLLEVVGIVLTRQWTAVIDPKISFMGPSRGIVDLVTGH